MNASVLDLGVCIAQTKREASSQRNWKSIQGKFVQQLSSEQSKGDRAAGILKSWTPRIAVYI